MTRAVVAVAAGATMVLVGLVFDVYALLLPGLALVALAVGAAVWVSAAAHGASVVRELPGDRVEEEERWPVRIAVRQGLVPPPRTGLADPLLGPADTPLAPRRPRARVDVRFGRRGRRHLEGSRVLIHDPLWLAVRELRGVAGEVLVLPRIEPVEATGARGGASGVATAPSRLEAAGAELELDALRPYRPGTAASRIHWPTVARTGEMVERRLVAEGDERPVVALDARRPTSAEALDRAVRAAASLVLHLGRARGCGLLLPGERRPMELERDLAAWPALHARLAAVEETNRPPVLEAVGRRGAVYWVSAGDGGAPPALGRAQAAERFLVTPETGARGGPTAFTVAGCVGRSLGRAARTGRRVA
ncbi:MAG: DUF58 domain-containing protein [Thermoleophilaceae bacterium]